MPVSFAIGTLSPAKSPIWTSPFPPSGKNIYSELPEISTKTQPNPPISLILPEEKITIQDLPGEVKKLPEDQPSKVVSVYSNQPFIETLLLMHTSAPAKYTGVVTPETIWGCHMIASKLGDIYDTEKQHLVHTQFIQNNYFDIVSKEWTEGRTLIAMDKDWILPLIAKYLDSNQEIGINRASILLEYIAVNQPVTSNGVPYVRWDNRPKFPDLDSRKWSLDDINIYTFNDVDIGYSGDNIDWTQYDSSVMMIFAPIDVRSAEGIYLYLYRELKYYSAKSYLAIKDLPLGKAKDFEYLYPVELTFVRNYVIFSSDQMFRQDLVDAFYYQRVSQKIYQIDPLLGAYGVYLLAEATNYRFHLSWENNIISIYDVGYIQAQDLIENFRKILTNITSEKVLYQKLPNYTTAVNLAQRSDIKCFYFENFYYAAVPEKIVFTELEDDSNQKISIVHLRGPLKSMELYPEPTKLYFESLGYEVLTDDEPYSIELDLGYRTYQQHGKKITVYYYLTSSEHEVDIHESEGPWSRDLFNELQRLLRQGYFFNQKMKNITTAYPDFIPNIPPINRKLSPYPEKAVYQISEKGI